MPILHCTPIKMRFVGRNGSMGLITGRVYHVVVYTYGVYLIARWGDGNDEQCPYETLKALNNNWEVITRDGGAL